MDYKNLSSKDMLALVNEDFYKLVPSGEELKKFTKIFVDKFSAEHNVRGGVRLVYDKLDEYEMYYVSQEKAIYINEFYIDKYEDFIKNNNYYYLKNYFEAIIHELRHHLQYNSADISPLLKNYLALTLIRETSDIAAQIPYETRLHEIDARYFTYLTLKDQTFFSKYYKMQAFVEGESGIDFDSYQFVELLKDEDLNSCKKLAEPIRVLDELTKKIAVKNGLRFNKQNSLDLHNDYYLNFAVGKEIAPDFFKKEFKKIRNPAKVEKELNVQRNEFIDYFNKYEEENKS